MRVALVHEFLTQMGGAERVLKALIEIWPDATLHVLVYDEQKTFGEFREVKKEFSFLNSTARNHHKLFLPFMPAAVEGFRFDKYDIVFSDSSSFAKGAIAKDKLHICFCHTPTRFLWVERKKYLEKQPYPGFMKLMASPVLSWLKKWDYKAAQRPNFFIANSKNVKQRIQKYYNRESVVIYPPIDTEFFKPVGTKKGYYFAASRLEPYKNMEIAVAAFNELGLPLKIAGSGTQLKLLQAKAKSNIEFLGRVSDEQLRQLYAEAKAYVFPAEEDAGMMVLEAQACGTPVIAYRAGGALELVKETVTGEFFEEQTPESLAEKIRHFNGLRYSTEAIREFAKQFDKKVFQSRIKEFVEEKFKEFKQ